MIRLLRRDDLEIFRSLRLEALRLEPESFASAAEDWEKLSDDEWSRRLLEADILRLSTAMSRLAWLR